MTTLIAKIIAGIVGLLVLIGVGMWVIGLGPFNTRPSAAAKLQPKVAATVSNTQAQAGAAVAAADTKARTANTATETRTEGHVAKIRAVAPRVAPVDIPDGEFFAGVCSYELYARSADCSGVGGQPEGRRSAVDAGSLRTR